MVPLELGNIAARGILVAWNVGPWTRGTHSLDEPAIEGELQTTLVWQRRYRVHMHTTTQHRSLDSHHEAGPPPRAATATRLVGQIHSSLGSRCKAGMTKELAVELRKFWQSHTRESAQAHAHSFKEHFRAGGHRLIADLPHHSHLSGLTVVTYLSGEREAWATLPQAPSWASVLCRM